jgi:hypothetical protein
MDVPYGKVFRQRAKTQHFFTGKDSGYLNKFFDEHKNDSFNATAARQQRKQMALTTGGRKRKHTWQEIPRKPYASDYRRQTTRVGTKKKRPGRGKAKRYSKKGRSRRTSRNVHGPGYANYASQTVTKYKAAKLAKNLTWAKQPVIYEDIRTFSIASLLAGAPGRTDQGKQIMMGINSDVQSGIGLPTVLVNIWESHSKFRTTAGAWVGLEADHPNLMCQSLYLKSISTSWSFTNQAPTSTEGDLYIIMRKTSLKTWGATRYLTDWTSGLTATAADGTPADRSFYNSKPTDSKQFNMNWWIIKKVSFKLEPGQEMKHTHVLNANRLLDLAYLKEWAGGVRGITMESFIVAKGPVVDSTNSMVSGSISTARVKLVGIQNAKYVAYAVQTNPKIILQGSNVTTNNTTLYSIADAAGTVIDTEVPANYA